MLEHLTTKLINCLSSEFIYRLVLNPPTLKKSIVVAYIQFPWAIALFIRLSGIVDYLLILYALQRTVLKLSPPIGRPLLLLSPPTLFSQIFPLLTIDLSFSGPSLAEGRSRGLGWSTWTTSLSRDRTCSALFLFLPATVLFSDTFLVKNLSLEKVPISTSSSSDSGSTVLLLELVA